VPQVSPAQQQVANEAAKRGWSDDLLSTVFGGATEFDMAGGIRNFFGNRAASVAEAGTPQALRAAANLRNMGGKLAFGSRILGPLGAVVGTGALLAGAASEGNQQAGTFGAVNNAGSAAAGAGLGALTGGAIGSLIPLPGIGTALGASVGSWLGGEAGKAVGRGTTGIAQGIVESGGFGANALDPLIQTPDEVATYQQNRMLMDQMNTPAQQMIMGEQRKRDAEARARQSEAMLLQAYMGG
jgi:hypothetical protein